MTPFGAAAALNALKKKKMVEAQLEAVENNIARVNEQQGMLENQRRTVETMGALQYGAHASKQTMSDMKITDVDHVLEEISDQADQMSQIQDAMSQPLGTAADMDMDELEAELEVGRSPPRGSCIRIPMRGTCMQSPMRGTCMQSAMRGS